MAPVFAGGDPCPVLDPLAGDSDPQGSLPLSQVCVADSARDTAAKGVNQARRVVCGQDGDRPERHDAPAARPGPLPGGGLSTPQDRRAACPRQAGRWIRADQLRRNGTDRETAGLPDRHAGAARDPVFPALGQDIAKGQCGGREDEPQEVGPAARLPSGYAGSCGGVSPRPAFLKFSTDILLLLPEDELKINLSARDVLP